MSDTIPQDSPQRQCIRCLITKPFCDFWKSSRYSDGIEHTCIECRRLMKQGKITGSREAAVQERIFSGMKECNTCHRSLPLAPDFFNRVARNPDGFSYVCRDCRMASRRTPPKPRTIPEGMKRCCICKQVLPADTEHFNCDSREPSGLNPRCIPCHRAYNREWDHNKHPLKGPHLKDGMKRCFACREWFPLTEEYFVKSSTSQFGFNSRCIPCHRKKHSEDARKDGNTRRARQKGIQGTFTSTQIQEQLKRQKYRCYYAACGHARFKKDKTRAFGYDCHIDHTYPLSRVVGTGIPANDVNYLVLACPHCNVSKGDKFPWEWIEGGRLL